MSKTVATEYGGWQTLDLLGELRLLQNARKQVARAGLHESLRLVQGMPP